MCSKKIYHLVVLRHIARFFCVYLCFVFVQITLPTSVVPDLSQKQEILQFHQQYTVSPSYGTTKHPKIKKAINPGQISALIMVGAHDLLAFLHPLAPNGAQVHGNHCSPSWSVLGYPILLCSSSTVLLQLFLGRPGLLFPSGFDFSSFLVTLQLVFLRVCPIKPHFLLLIWMLILSSSVVAIVLHLL